MADHTIHRYSRLLSSTEERVGLYGCEHPRCSSTETRPVGSPSPYQQRHQAKRARRKGATPV